MDSITAVRELNPADADAGARGGTLTIVDVRPPPERALATIAAPYAVLDDGGLEALLARPKDTQLAFLCHHGSRSAQAAEYFRAQGFGATYNISGGIEAWALTVDATIPHY